jgi:small subunit ribosomal protein S17
MSSKRFVGVVVSNKMKDTVVVTVEQPKRHPIYGKIIKNTKRIKAHTAEPLKLNEVVEIMETRPYAKQVAFKVLNKMLDKESKGKENK